MNAAMAVNEAKAKAMAVVAVSAVVEEAEEEDVAVSVAVLETNAVADSDEICESFCSESESSFLANTQSKKCKPAN